MSFEIEKFPHLEQTLTENKDFINPPIEIGELKALCEGDETLTELIDYMVDYFYRYAETVCMYNEILSSGNISDKHINEKLAKLEEERVRIHNATSDSINILSRNMAKRNRDTSWTQIVGTSRAAHGKFALTTVFHELIQESQNTNQKGE